MERHRFNWERFAILLVGAITAALASCEQPSKPTSTLSQVAATTDSASCQEDCLLVGDDRPFRLAHAARDSSGVMLDLAGFTVSGNAGDAIQLTLSASGKPLLADQQANIVIDAGGSISHVRLADLLTPRIVYEFQTAGTIEIHYMLPRSLPFPTLTALRLSQHLIGGTVQSSRTPWAKQSTLVSPLTNAQCTINSASITACRIKVTIAPFHASSWAQSVGGLWTGSDTSEASPTIVVTFDKPVSNITLTIADPDYVGNAMVAFDSVGHQLGSVAFIGDNKPGVPSHSQQSLLVTGIRRLELRAAPLDFVAYENLVFEAPPIVVEPLILTPVSATRKAGQPVTYKVTSQSGNPVQVTVWTWLEDGAPQRGAPMTAPNCGTSTTCTFPIYENGWLFVDGNVGTSEGTEPYAYTWVTPCPSDTDSDPMMHNPTFRREMASLLANMTQFEQGQTSILRLSDSTFGSISYPNRYIGHTDTVPCNHYSPDFTHPSQVLPPDFVPVTALSHTHPVAKGDILPAACAAGLKNQVVTFVLDGPSPEDINTVTSSGFVGYIVAKGGYVYRFNGPGDSPGHSKRWKVDSDANGSSACAVADSHWTG